MERNCELCDGVAFVYCSSDNAYLCDGCDSKVHCANFLVARHVRSYVCRSCLRFEGNRFSGAGGPPVSCRSCDPTVAVVDGFGLDMVDDGNGDGDDDSMSSCSSCVSSTGEAVEEVETTSVSKRGKINGVGKRGRNTVVGDLKVEGVLVNWCRRMGGGVEEREILAVVNKAVELLASLDRMTSLPFRVSLAAAFWVAFKIVCRRCGGSNGGGGGGGGIMSSSTCQDLKSVEQISGVPGKLILATEAKLARVIRPKKSREDHKEGWAEC